MTREEVEGVKATCAFLQDTALFSPSLARTLSLASRCPPPHLSLSPSHRLTLSLSLSISLSPLPTLVHLPAKRLEPPGVSRKSSALLPLPTPVPRERERKTERGRERGRELHP